MPTPVSPQGEGNNPPPSKLTQAQCYNRDGMDTPTPDTIRYPTLIDGEDGAYGVVFPDLPGCVAMGATVDEALTQAEEAARDWVESMEAHGQSIPAPSDPENVEVAPGSTLTSVSLTRSAPIA